MGGMIWSAVTGMAAGWIGGPYTSVDIGFDLTSPWLDQQILKTMYRREVARAVFREAPRSFAAGILSELPDPLYLFNWLEEVME